MFACAFCSDIMLEISTMYVNNYFTRSPAIADYVIYDRLYVGSWVPLEVKFYVKELVTIKMMN